MKNVAVFLKDSFIPLPPPKLEDTVVEVLGESSNDYNSKYDKKKGGDIEVEVKSELDVSSVGSSSPFPHRRLKNRQIQLIGIGGTIGTALFVSIGQGLNEGGPLSLLLGYSLWCIPVLLVTTSCAELVSHMPISSPFIRMAGKYVDEALEVTAGWNFWFLECALIPFEVVAFNTIIHFWTDDYSPAIPLAIQVFAYFLINVLAVSFYGESEFWLAIGKVVLALGLLLFTFITMVGGNPKHDAYGFRYWRNPGPMAEYISTGSLGRFEGFLACMIQACFTIAGPEYVSMTAGECINPRKVLPKAYKQVAYRLTFFFVFGSLCVGICCAYNDPLLVAAISEGKPGAGSSPYIVAMTNLNIKILPHIVNVLLLTSSFSAGNSYTFCSARALYGLAVDGRAPKIFTYCTKKGIPIYCILVSNCWAMLSFLQLNEKSETVLDWIVNLVTTSQLINFMIICTTYLKFYYAMKDQNFDRNSLPFKGFGQPYVSYIAIAILFSMMWVSGYAVFLPGRWSIKTFLFSYLMIFIDLAIFIGWKVIKRTSFVHTKDVDIYFAMEEIEEYESVYYAMKAAEEKQNQDTSAVRSAFRRAGLFLWGEY